MSTLSDTTWLLLWQIWQDRHQQDFHSTKALIHRVLELEMEAGQEAGSKDMSLQPFKNALGVCICGEYTVGLLTTEFVLLTGCEYCGKSTNAREVSVYISWLYHTLAADYGIVMSTDSIRERLARVLYQYI